MPVSSTGEVPDGRTIAPVALVAGCMNPHRNFPLLGEFYGIPDQVDQDLPEAR